MKPKIYAMIPARIGSQRLKMKNLALLNNKPLIYYALNAAKKTKIFDKIILNSDHKIFKKIAKRYKVDFYLRPKKFGTSKSKSDEVVYDFFQKFPKQDILVWVNPIAPLQKYEEIRKVVNYFKRKKIDSLITTSYNQVHSIYKKKPINFSLKKKFDKTQDLEPVENFAYSLMIWKKKVFVNQFLSKKYAIICGKFKTYPVNKESALLIKNFTDLKIAEAIIKSQTNKFIFKLEYDKIFKSINYGS